MGKYGQKLIGRIFGVFKKWALIFSAGFIFALLCFVLLNAAMHPVSKSNYCGTKCHEMHKALHTWKQSVHGGSKTGLQAECIDCHLPRKDKFFSHMIAKAYAGGKDMYKHYKRRLFGGEYETEKIRTAVLERMSNEKCTRCHVDLLGKPSNEMVREAHMESLKPADASEEVKCIECHEDVGHQRSTD